MYTTEAIKILEVFTQSRDFKNLFPEEQKAINMGCEALMREVSYPKDKDGKYIDPMIR